MGCHFLLLLHKDILYIYLFICNKDGWWAQWSPATTSVCITEQVVGPWSQRVFSEHEEDFASFPKANEKLLKDFKERGTAAAAAKSLQLCLTLCNPIDGSSPGPTFPGILQVRTLEWVAISSSNAWKWKVKVKSLSRVRLLATPWTAAYQASPPMGFSRQEYWSGLPLPSLKGELDLPFKTIALVWVGCVLCLFITLYDKQPLTAKMHLATSLSGISRAWDYIEASLVALMVKHLPAMWETQVQFLGWEDPLEKKWQSTPVFLPGKSHGWRSLVGYSPCGSKESDTTEWLHFLFKSGK